MHQFYRLFPDALIAKQAVSQLESREIVKQDVSQIDDRELVFLVPWGHMVQIINKCMAEFDISRATVFRDYAKIKKITGAVYDKNESVWKL